MSATLTATTAPAALPDPWERFDEMAHEAYVTYVQPTLAQAAPAIQPARKPQPRPVRKATRRKPSKREPRVRVPA